MILADTSVWVDHFGRRDQALMDLLSNDHESMHPFVRGELALGNPRPRAEILQLLSDLPRATVAEESELRHIVDNRKLMGLGIGLIDAHLVASTLLDKGELFTNGNN